MKNVIFLFSMFAFVGGCQEKIENKQLQKKIYLPVVLGIAYDISGSMKQWPALDSALTRELLRHVSKRGGVLAFGHIKTSSYTELLRFNLKMDTIPVSGKLTERGQQISKNKKLKQRYDDENTKAYTIIMDKINVKKNSKGSDIVGCLRRFSLLFQETQFTTWDKILVIISDGEYKTLPKSTDIPDVDILTVGMASEKAKSVFGQDVKMFESLSGVLSYLEAANVLKVKDIQERK